MSKINVINKGSLSSLKSLDGPIVADGFIIDEEMIITGSNTGYIPFDVISSNEDNLYNLNIRNVQGINHKFYIHHHFNNNNFLIQNALEVYNSNYV